MRCTTFLVFFLAFAPAWAQTNSDRCPCSQIGIDASWADSNKVSCYLVPVYRDVTNKSAGKFKLAVAVAASLRNTKEAPLLYLHGGPGIATLENLPKYLKSDTWNSIRQERSIVFFDYRGTGSSEPVLCPDVADSLSSAAGRNLSPEAMQSYRIKLFGQCRERHLSDGVDIASFNSFQMAEDAEHIRKSLQIDKWNVYGVSYGTTVALNLLRSYDKHIRSMILDSPFPPNAPWLDFVRPFAASFKVLEEKIGNDAVASQHFSATRTDFVKAVERLNKVPFKIVINDSGATYPFTGNDFAWSIWSALLKPAAIPFVPLTIKEVANGNDSVISKWAMAFSNPDAFGKFSEYQSKAVLCYEGTPRTQADTKASLQAQYPEFASFNMDFEDELCRAWQPTRASGKVFEPVTSKVPVLIFSGEYDPVCPPLFGEITAKTLSASTFINVPAASHAAIHADACTRQLAERFLSAPAKKPDVECIKGRKQISFITDSLAKALSGLKR